MNILAPSPLPLGHFCATLVGSLKMLHIYIKTWCPWCEEALETLDALGVKAWVDVARSAREAKP